jgi:SPP1 gp7 family putative phage head morphogenesis protein
MARDPHQIGIPVPFEEAIAVAKRRGVVLPEVFYGHLPAAARSRAFTVSGLGALDQITGIMDSMTAATESGIAFQAWKKLALANLPKGRLETIFRNAIQTHYNIGRWEQLEGNQARRPYLMYDAINDGRTRPAHRAMDNHIAPIDDPIWNRWYPPNGFRCRCSVIGLTEAQAKARGYGTKPTPDAQPDKGWDYHPAKGQDEALRRVIQDRRNQCGSAAFARKRGGRGRGVWCENRGMDYLNMLAAALDSAAPMPPPRQLGLRLLDVGMPEQQYLETFMREFGARWNETAMLKDKTGYHILAVSRSMFVEHKTGGSKVTKAGRAPYLLYVASTILDPDEIRLHEGGHGDRALYLLSRYVIRQDVMNIFAVFKEDGNVWTGRTGYQDHRPEYLKSKRGGILIYRRPET